MFCQIHARWFYARGPMPPPSTLPHLAFSPLTWALWQVFGKSARRSSNIIFPNLLAEGCRALQGREVAGISQDSWTFEAVGKDYWVRGRCLIAWIWLMDIKVLKGHSSWFEVAVIGRECLRMLRLFVRLVNVVLSLKHHSQGWLQH